MPWRKKNSNLFHTYINDNGQDGFLIPLTRCIVGTELKNARSEAGSHTGVTVDRVRFSNRRPIVPVMKYKSPFIILVNASLFSPNDQIVEPMVTHLYL